MANKRKSQQNCMKMKLKTMKNCLTPKFQIIQVGQKT